MCRLDKLVQHELEPYRRKFLSDGEVIWAGECT